MNMASLSPAPEDKSESAKPATANTPNVAALSVISGTIRLKNVKMPPPTVLLARCITATDDYISSKKLLGIVIYEKSASQNGWVMTHKPVATDIAWGGYETDIPGLTNITSESSLTDIQASCTNTDIITAYGNGSTYPAAWVAKNYTGGDKTWCLPSGGLLRNALDNSANFTKFNAAILEIQSEAGTSAATILGNVYNGYEHVWSSSEYDNYDAWGFYAKTSGSFNMINYGKSSYGGYRGYSLRPVMAF